MKQYLTLFLALALATVADASRVLVTWQPNPENDIAGYRVHWGTATRDYQTIVEAGNTNSAIIDNIPDDKVTYFAITAYNTSQLESDYSREATYWFGHEPPGRPKILKIEVLPDEDPQP